MEEGKEEKERGEGGKEGRKGEIEGEEKRREEN